MEIMNGVHWVGVVDPQVRSFFGQELSTPQGTTFNAYLILGERIACVASLRSPYIHQVIENIEQVADPADIDYLVLNQIELNDPAALTTLKRLMPSARMLVPSGVELPRHPAWKYQELQKGEHLDLGNREIVLLEACGVPWPDAMILYVPGNNLLLSQHLFGQHWASSHRFDDRVDPSRLFRRALRYYVSLFAPAHERVRNAIDRLRRTGVPVDAIAPSNGVMWRSQTSGILDSYARWSERLPEKRAVVVYETVLKSTEYMAEAVVRGISAEGVPCSNLRISLWDREDVLTEIFRAGALVLGSPTVHRRVLPAVGPLLQSVGALGLRNRIGAAFGSYGWSGESRNELERLLEESGISIRENGVYARMRPSSSDLERCETLGRRIAAELKRL
jgi:flavorubredoxin